MPSHGLSATPSSHPNLLCHLPKFPLLRANQCSSGRSLPSLPSLQTYIPKKGEQKVPVFGELEVRKFREEERDML